jgi:hypothetical protein
VTIERITTVAVEAAVTVLSETIDSVVASEKVTRQTNEWKTRGKRTKRLACVGNQGIVTHGLCSLHNTPSQYIV